ncbi:MAG: hypothetical protein ACLPX5_08835 [Dissulfurispiraceae bacterium]
MNEEELARQSPASLRIAEAEYFLQGYVKHCGPPIDSYFGMVCCFDAFLFALVSVEDMLKPDTRKRLNEDSFFKFIKALRNITAHHSILAAPIPGNKFQRPFSRIIHTSVGGDPNDSSRLVFRFDILRSIFDAIERERLQEAKTLGIARDCLSALEARGSGKVFLEDIMEQALAAARAVLADA